MTGYGGLAASFDGDDNETNLTASVASGVSYGWVGKDWGSGVKKKISRYAIVATNNEGFVSTCTYTTTISLE